MKPWLSRFQSGIGLLLVFILAVLFSPHARDGSIIFLNLGNLSDVLRQQAEIGIIALAMTLVIISGGIDLSVGSIVAFSASLLAMLLVRWNGAGPSREAIAMAAAIGACALIGMVNGVIVARLRIQPFIVTLSAMIAIRGLARWMTNNNNIDFGFGQDLSARFAALFSDKLLVILLWAILSVIFYLLLEYTLFGRYLRAVGENEKAARFTGLPIARVKLAAYILSGLAAGLAGVLHAARSHQGNPNDGVAYELDAIAAVVIGGTPLSGGQGSIAGTVVGTLIMGILTNLLRLRLIDANLELMIKAVIIIAAVWMQSVRKSSKA
ncbi:MAG TPA: ABC transporter permease [Chthoniobacteraceae bacterium]|jgi:ribose transport system permease protein|nr:ABC transporter permease [Chthoniobacteraceae bacterium]